MSKSSSSSPYHLLVDQQNGIKRAALVSEAGRLTDFFAEEAAAPLQAGDLFIGRVGRMMGGMNACFVDLGVGKQGILSVGDVRARHMQKRKKAVHIGQLIHTGQYILVQVKAEGYGEKGPQLTMDISFSGRFLVYLPLSHSLSVSRRIKNNKEFRAKLEEFGLPAGGWIIRGSAVDASDAQLKAEAEFLAMRWLAAQKAQEKGKSAGKALRVYKAPSLIERALCEAGGQNLQKITVTDMDLAADLQAWLPEIEPELASSLSVAEKDEYLFDRYDVSSQLQEIAQKTVTLADGGTIVIEPTEALIVIDVNGGDQATALDANLAAADEIARQIRLRNLGGIIVVDFINLSKPKEIESLLSHFRWRLSSDPVSTQLYDMSRLGLVELTRARRGKAWHQLEEKIHGL